MSSASLPERPSLEYLKKLAKERLVELRVSVAAFFRACAAGDVSVLRELLNGDPALVRESSSMPARTHKAPAISTTATSSVGQPAKATKP